MRNVLITGANRGIGLALARAHQARGDRVHAVVRAAGDALPALGVALREGVDLAAADAPAALAAAFPGVPFDRVWLNAGILRAETLADFDAAAGARVLEQFVVNALAPLRAAAALRPRLARGATLALMTSRMGSIDDNSSGGYYGYRMSKAALNAAGRSLAHDLHGDGVTVLLLHPGYVRTDMTGGHGERSADEAAAQLLACVDARTLADSGTFWHANGTRLPW